ncbi:MAG TPA: RNA methyltransferase [Nitrososphaerales archaeon]|nr:RNA methyltransferase [Nitrososphaerales archaeon]
MLLGKKLGVAIPDTVLEERDTLRDKTVKVGTIARALAIYGVDSVAVFRDEKGRGEGPLIRKLLGYLETPQYLRKRIYQLDEELKFAGLLPPLRIPSHRPRTPLEGVKVGEVREGVVNQDGTVDVGLERPARLRGNAASGARVTVELVSKEPFTAKPVPRDGLREYWGYIVKGGSFREAVSDSAFDLKVATSRLGSDLRTVIEPLGRSFKSARGAVLLFGSPSRGLFDIVGPNLTKQTDYVVNLFADQQVETVRTEEAIFAALNLAQTLII